MTTAFWSEQKVLILGAGSFGTILSQLVAPNVRQLQQWVRTEETARQMNATKANPHHLSQMELPTGLVTSADYARLFSEQPKIIIWALPSKITRAQARVFAGYFQGDEILIHVTKGIEAGTLKTVSQIFYEELACPRVGVLSGPNIAGEMARREPAGALLASKYEEVIEAGQAILASRQFLLARSADVLGVEWCGALKNIYAIGSGILAAQNLGQNTRALFLTHALREMSEIVARYGAHPKTVDSLAGVGDLIATCSSQNSRNFRVGLALGLGQDLDAIVDDIGEVAEGVVTARAVVPKLLAQGLSIRLAQSVYELMEKKMDVQAFLKCVLSS